MDGCQTRLIPSPRWESPQHVSTHRPLQRELEPHLPLHRLPSLLVRRLHQRHLDPLSPASRLFTDPDRHRRGRVPSRPGPARSAERFIRGPHRPPLVAGGQLGARRPQLRVVHRRLHLPDRARRHVPQRRQHELPFRRRPGVPLRRADAGAANPLRARFRAPALGRVCAFRDHHVDRCLGLRHRLRDSLRPGAGLRHRRHRRSRWA